MENYSFIKDKEGNEYKVKLVELNYSKNKKKLIYLAYNEKGEEIGRTAVTLTEKGRKKEAKISDVETKEGYRKKGIATELLNLAEEKAVKEGYGNQFNLYVLNPLARKIYKKMGFEPTKRRTNIQIMEMIKKSPSRKVREAWEEAKEKNKKMRRRV